MLFWKFSKYKVENEETGEEEERGSVFVKCYSVFHASQVEGFDLDAWRVKRDRQVTPTEPADMVQTWDDLGHVDGVIAEYVDRSEGLTVEEIEGDRACYSPIRHKVTVPTRKQFNGAGAAGFYSTYLHELAHSTGHPKLLNRSQKGGFGSEQYAKEELVAESTASILCGTLGVTIEDHVQAEHSIAYIRGWLKSVKRTDGAKALIYAIQQAQKAAELISPVVVVEGNTGPDLVH